MLPEWMSEELKGKNSYLKEHNRMIQNSYFKKVGSGKSPSGLDVQVTLPRALTLSGGDIVPKGVKISWRCVGENVFSCVRHRYT